MERAVAYIRVSDKRQAEAGNSLASQERQVREYAERKGYGLGRVWIEEGVTAKTADRPVLKALLKDLALGRDRPAVLIVPKIDRFARYVEDHTALKAQLKRLAVRLESVGENLEDSPVGRFTEHVLASVAQFDNEIRAERCKGGMEEAVREGRWVWKAPVGYRNVRIGRHGKKRGIGNIEPRPAEAQLILHAFERIAALDRPADVRRWLERNGVAISAAAFAKALRNPVYTGRIVAFGETNVGKPPFVPIVSDDTFRRAQAALSRASGGHKRPYERENPEFPLRGTVLCECGGAMSAGWARGQRQRYAYYRCHSCKGVNVRRERVEQAFRAELAAFRPDESRLAERKADVRAAWQARALAKPLRLAEISKALTDLDELSDALALQTARGVIPEETAKRQFASFKLQRQSLEESRAGYDIEERDLPALLDFASGFLGNLGGFWEGSSLEIKKKLQSFLYPRGLVYQRNGSFRTSDYPLLEQTKSLFNESSFTLVDLDFETANGLLEWVSELDSTFNRTDEGGLIDGEEGVNPPLGEVPPSPPTPRRSRG